jgi:hypothetical protein
MSQRMLLRLFRAKTGKRVRSENSDLFKKIDVLERYVLDNTHVKVTFSHG